VNGPPAAGSAPRAAPLSHSPSESEKASYAWRSLPFLATALSVSALCLIVAQVWFEVRYVRVLPVVVGAFAAYTAAYLVYQVVSLPVNFAGRGFDLAAHRELLAGPVGSGSRGGSLGRPGI